ncbi:LysR family transcriptional regulator [Variovorax sp. Sphag1AA]|uniref:LysR family transcriptional regulator n=1 Tax=Variovorax sp. Sphag1AA TaxID=2587027 RepID=UPI0016177FA3|nr:LysR family transcriptional regulator [Variovorax sp. Sphag1AA]MBB3181668.1 DNA-binding transcriptional LysR family regulator [Variovorax sp. Sphag1AA]
MNLQQLDHLLALAETCTFSRASEKVHLTQPALSRSIQMLEQELGLPLVDQIGKRNELTPFGAVVLERAKRISMEAHEMRRSAVLLTEGATGTLHIGLGGAPSAVFSSPLLIHMLRHQPRVGLQLRSGSADVHGAALRSRALDAMVVTYRAVVPREDLRIEVLPTMRSGFVCRRGHPLLKRRKLRLADLRRYPVISTGVSDDIARLLVERYGSGANPQRWLHVTSDEIGALIEAVRSTDAIFLGVLATTRRLLDSGELVELALEPSADLSAQFAFITLEGRTEAPALGIVREFLSGLAQAEKSLMACPTRT